MSLSMNTQQLRHLFSMHVKHGLIFCKKSINCKSLKEMVLRKANIILSALNEPSSDAGIRSSKTALWMKLIFYGNDGDEEMWARNVQVNKHRT
jgi:hypothetical protein